MARKDDSGGDEDDRITGTLRAIKSVGHPASGGHSPRVQRAIAAGNWTVIDDPDDGEDDVAYDYQEYPKFVTREDDETMIVRSEDEELTFLSGSKVVRDADERARLIKVAAVKGVTIDKRWALPKIIKAISGAGFDPALDPDGAGEPVASVEPAPEG